MEFSEAFEDQLVHSQWQAATDDSTSTPYLFKFAYNEDDMNCCFLVTDTKRVWAEALASRHVLHRARRVNSADEDDSMDPDEEKRKALSSLVTLHSLRNADSLELSAVESEDADLVLSIVGESMTWRWELEALPRSRAADLLSEHLIMPLLGLNSVLLDAEQAVPQSDAEVRDFEKKIDASGRTAIRHRHRLVTSLIGQPIFSTALRRWMETAASTPKKSEVFRNAEDEPASRLAERAPLEAPTAPSVRSRHTSKQPSPAPRSPTPAKSPAPRAKSKPKAAESSETETEAEEEEAAPSSSPAKPSPSPSPEPAPTPAKGQAAKRRVVSDDDDDDEEPAKPELKKKVEPTGPKSRIKIKRTKY